MTSSDLRLTVMSLIMGVTTSLLVGAGAWIYLRRVRMERPAIGRFNNRDVAVVFVLLATLPVLYLQLPRWLLTTFLGITFTAALSIGLRELMSPTKVWLTVGTLLGLDIWLGRNLLGTVLGWQVYWAENSLIVLLGAISVANLYVQGGMQLRHVAWFAAALAVYDVIFSEFWPVTNQLVQEFLGYPLDPSMGMRVYFDNTAVGIGDLLVYGVFVAAALKAYGRPAARLALGLVVVFGAVVPALVPLVIDFVDPTTTDVLVPAQAWFGPAAFLGYRWLLRTHGRERTTAEFLASSDFLGRRRRGVPPVAAAVPAVPPAAAPAPAGQPATAQPAGATLLDATS
jgi:hypothetical protein